MPKTGRVFLKLKRGMSSHGSIWLHHPEYKHILNVTKLNISQTYDIGVFSANSRLVFALITLSGSNHHSDSETYNDNCDHLDKLQLDANKWEVRCESGSASKEQEVNDMAMDIEVVDTLVRPANNTIYQRQDVLKISDKANDSLNSIAPRRRSPIKTPNLDTPVSLLLSGSGNTATVCINGLEIVAKDANGAKIAAGVAGRDDYTVINSAVSLGGLIYIASGTYINPAYNSSSFIVPPSNTEIVGCEGVILQNIWFKISGVHDVIVRNLRFTGKPFGPAIYIGNLTQNITLKNLIATHLQYGGWDVTDVGRSCFAIYSMVSGISSAPKNILFEDCRSEYGDRFGFLIDAANNTDCYVADIIYNRCVAHGVGFDVIVEAYSPGFDIERGVVDNVSYIDCVAEESLESGFHQEFAPPITNVRYIRCKSINNGQKYSQSWARGQAYVKYANSAPRHLADYVWYPATRKLYECILDHISVTLNEPGVGANWQTYWKALSSSETFGYGFICSADHNVMQNCIAMGNPREDIGFMAIKHGEICGCVIGEANSAKTCNIVRLEGCEDIIIRGNEIKGRYPIYVYSDTPSDHGIKIDSNKIEISQSGGEGLRLADHRIKIANNRIFSTSGVDGTGITDLGWGQSKNNLITGNTLIGLASPASAKLSPDRNTYRWNLGYITEALGSSIGIGSEQNILHGLAAIPKGCKAWIKYLLYNRYVTKDIPFDAKSIYPNVQKGVAYEWRIE